MGDSIIVSQAPIAQTYNGVKNAMRNASTILHIPLPPLNCSNMSQGEVNGALSVGRKCIECNTTAMASNSTTFLNYGCVAPMIKCENLTASEIGAHIIAGKTCDCTFIKFNDTRRHDWQCKNRTTTPSSIVLDEEIANSTTKSDTPRVVKSTLTLLCRALKKSTALEN